MLKLIINQIKIGFQHNPYLYGFGSAFIIAQIIAEVLFSWGVRL